MMILAMQDIRYIAWRVLGLSLLMTLLLAGCSSPTIPDSSSDYEGTALGGQPAPDFHLIDQHGGSIALSDFRGKVVVLAFLDSQCKDVCPLTAAQLRQAYKTLGDQARSVIFLGVNVNLQAAQVSDVAVTTDQWKLNEIPSWHFLTGEPEELGPVWKAYYIAVQPAPDSTGELMHTSGVYVIDQLGREQWYISNPLAAPGNPSLSEVLVKRIQELLGEIK